MGKQKWSTSLGKPISVVWSHKHKKWLQWLHLAEWWYNITYHTTMKMDPFQALYSYEPPRWKEIIQGITKLPIIKDHLEENQRIMQTLKDNLTIA